MLFKIKHEIWFDNDKLYIIKGKYNKYIYTMKYEKFMDIDRRSQKSIYPTIVFLSSTRCNLKCRYCFAHEGTYGNNTEKQFFDFESYIKIFDSTMKQFEGINGISFFGGEPLLNFDEIKKFVEYIFEKYDKDKIPYMAMASNGIIMNQEIKEFLVKYNVGYCTSLDGPKIFNDINRIGYKPFSVYDKVMNTLNFLDDISIRKSIQFTIGKSHLENYQKGDFSNWISEFEKLNIESYEIVAVTADDIRFRINLEDPVVYNNYCQLCNDIADHCLNIYKEGKNVPMPKIFAGLLLHIIKRVYQEDCSAGFSFCVSPDLKIYPCHVCADDISYGIDFTENFREEIRENIYYRKVSEVEKEKIPQCASCIAKNVCSYICKGLTCRNGYKLPPERCVMMQIFTEKVIVFLAEEYENNREAIKQVLLKVSTGVMNDQNKAGSYVY